MLERRDSFRPYSEPHFAHREQTLRAPNTAGQNRILAALPRQDFERLLPYLEFVVLPLGWRIHGAGDPEKYLYLITAGIVARFYLTEEGASTAFALTGSEGVIGLSLFLDNGIAPSHALVVSPGYAYRLRAPVLKNEFKHLGSLSHLLLRYTQMLLNQAQQSAVCNRHHSLEQQLCCWILSCLDRLSSNKLSMTQELIANMLGVRREGVTEAAGKLQKAGLVHYSRGHITVLDRTRLEAHACECYAIVKRAHTRLLGLGLLPNIYP